MSDKWEMEFVTFDVAHFRSHRRFAQWNLYQRTFEVAHCGRVLVAEVNPASYDAYVVTGFELMHALAPWTETKPFVLYTDTTDKLSHAQVASIDPSPFADVKRRAKDLVTGAVYGPLMRRNLVALAESQWCANSLSSDYGLPLSSIWIASATMDLGQWSLPSRREPLQHRKPRLLFVGNDFHRKGGPFLLEVFAQLGGRCDLTIVSKDPAAGAAATVPGVTVLHGLDHGDLAPIIQLYHDSDVLVFPSWLDKLPNVVREACATGLPIVARDCGAIASLVHDGVNGRLLPFRSSPAEWIGAIEGILADQDAFDAMGRASRRIAESLLSREILSKHVHEALRRTRAELM